MGRCDGLGPRRAPQSPFVSIIFVVVSVLLNLWDLFLAVYLLRQVGALVLLSQRKDRTDLATRRADALLSFARFPASSKPIERHRLPILLCMTVFRISCAGGGKVVAGAPPQERKRQLRHSTVHTTDKAARLLPPTRNVPRKGQ
jgi:hypothetical protein